MVAPMQHEAKACRQLWMMVLLTAVRDLVNGAPEGLAAHQVRSWIGTSDFAIVCSLAGFNPDLVKAKMRALESMRRIDDGQKRGRKTLLDTMAVAQ